MDISELTDDELWFRTRTLACAERVSTYALIEHLAEMDKRRLAEKKAQISLFEFCIHQLHLSEEAAYRRIRAARAIRKFPPLSILLRDGEISVETAALLNPFLEGPDAAALVKSCIGMRKWQVQALLAGRQPEATKRDVIRYCGPAPAPLAVAPQPTPLLEPPDSAVTPPLATPPPPPAPLPLPRNSPVPVHAIRVSFSAGAEFHKLLRRAQSLLRHKYPDGRLEGVLQDALTALLRKKDLGFRWGNPGPRRGRRRRN